jgi:dihydrofolate reductase
VASKTLDKVEWHNSSLVRDVASEVAELKRRYPRELQVHGSAGLAQTLLEHDLVDELNLMIFPVVLGTGKRLFGNGTVPTALELETSRTSSTGVIMTRFRRVGPPQYGSFMLDP